MARPLKTGLDYFPLDVGFLRDKKVRLLKTEFGAGSVLFVLYVLGKIYEDEGYYIGWDDDEVIIAADEIGCGTTPAYLREVLKGCLSRSLFDERVFQMFGVLTSQGIQRRYLQMCEKRSVIRLRKEYWLLPKEEISPNTLGKLVFNADKLDGNSINSEFTSDKLEINPQSKVKESKVKESNSNDQSDRFDEFWSMYPKKVSKKDAVRAWGKVRKRDIDLLFLALDRQKKSRDWQKENGKYVPNPATWLNGERWNDEVEAGDSGGTNNSGEKSLANAGGFDPYRYGKTV